MDKNKPQSVLLQTHWWEKVPFTASGIPGCVSHHVSSLKCISKLIFNLLHTKLKHNDSVDKFNIINKIEPVHNSLKGCKIPYRVALVILYCLHRLRMRCYCCSILLRLWYTHFRLTVAVTWNQKIINFRDFCAPFSYIKSVNLFCACKKKRLTSCSSF